MFGWLSVEEATAYSNHVKSLLIFSWLEFWCHSCHSCQGKIRIIAVVEVLLLLENKRMFQRFGKLTARRNKILMLTKIQVLSRAAKVNRYNFFKLSGAVDEQIPTEKSFMPNIWILHPYAQMHSTYRNIQFRNNRRVNTEWVQSTVTFSFLTDIHFCHPLLGSCRKTNYTNTSFRYVMSANMSQNT